MSVVVRDGGVVSTKRIGLSGMCSCVEKARGVLIGLSGMCSCVELAVVCLLVYQGCAVVLKRLWCAYWFIRDVQLS